MILAQDQAKVRAKDEDLARRNALVEQQREEAEATALLPAVEHRHDDEDKDDNASALTGASHHTGVSTLGSLPVIGR